jgi:hypothetical protein
MSGLERGGDLRFLTLTSSPDAPENIQRSWRALYMRMLRRGLVSGYIKVPELTKAGKLHLHILFRGKYIDQKLISHWWSEIHQSSVVDIRAFRPYGGKRRVANYMAKYMSKEQAGRYSWSWGWVWRGFAGHWTLWKRYWSRWFEREGVTTFSNCLLGWQLWLHNLYEIDIGLMAENYPPHVVIKLGRMGGLSESQLKLSLGGRLI